MADKAAYPTKEIREKCWAARDTFFKCLDNSNDEKEKCNQDKKLFEDQCPQQWVSHFERRRKFLQFKDKLEKGATDPIDANVKYE